MTKRRLAILVSVAVLAACSGATDDPIEPCIEGVFPAVTAGTTPTISWSPPCLAAALEIQDSAGTVIWALSADISIIPPSLPYGEVPLDVNETTPAAALVDNTRYFIGVFRRDINGNLGLIGTLAFQP
jgi:hypothetical protein